MTLKNKALLKDPETNNIITEFINDKKLARKADRTIESYTSILYRFFTDCPKRINEIEPNDILNWLEAKYSNKSPSTKCQRIAVLSTFFNYCVSEEYITKTPIKKYWRPKKPKSIPRYLEKSEYVKLLMTVEKLPLRDRAIFEFLASSGVRRSELVNLNVDDLDLLKCIALIRGKGRKERKVNFSEECAYLLDQLLQRNPPNQQAIFLNRFGNRISTRYIAEIIYRIGKKAGLKRRLRPHDLRHTFATYLLIKGAELEFVSDELGHANLNTTKIYARIPSNELFAIYDKYMG